MQKIKIFAFSLMLIFTLSGCSLESITGALTEEGEFDFENFSFEEFVETNIQSEDAAEEDVLNKYIDYLIPICQNVLEMFEGIEDVTIEYDGASEGEKFNVDINLEEIIGDKGELLENIGEVLEQFFAEYGDFNINLLEE